MKRIFLLFITISLTTCNVNNSASNSLEEVNFETVQDSYTLNSVVTVVLTNTSTETVGYNPCTSTLQRKQVIRWETVEKNSICSAYLALLEPGETTQYKINLQQGYSLQKTGIYRIITEVQFKEETFKLATDPFSINEGFRTL